MSMVSIAPYPKLAFHNPAGQFGAAITNHTDSTSPSDASLSNTAASYTTLGGKWQVPATATAVTDFALFGYAVPSTHRLWIESVAIDSVLYAVDMATGPTFFDWALGVNATAVSLATTDSGATYGPRRIPLGIHSWLTADKIGARPAQIVRNFNAPIPVEPSRFVHVILQIPTATATGSQKFRGTVTFSGRWERVGEITAGL